MFEEIKGLIRSRNVKMKMDKMTNNDLQNITATQDRATRIPLSIKSGGELKFACGSQGKSLKISSSSQEYFCKFTHRNQAK
jgi:hypothetical protein